MKRTLNRPLKRSLYGVGRVLAHTADRCLAEILDTYGVEADDLPPRDVPTTGWSSEEGDRALKRVVGLCLGVLLVILLFAQTHHYYQRHPFFHQR